MDIESAKLWGRYCRIGCHWFWNWNWINIFSVITAVGRNPEAREHVLQ